MTPFERLDQAMNQRRLELRLNWRQVAQAADISYTALRAIRKGEYRPTELTAQAIDRALRWPPGTVHAILDGRTSDPAEDGEIVNQGTENRTESHTTGAVEQPQPEGPPTLSQELELASRLMFAQVKELGLSPDEAEEAWRRAYQSIVESHEAASLSEPQPESRRRHQVG
ncbi:MULTISPECIES: helix-turn-helix domain-containing protein [Streptomyces]|uniref:helix-turn-helix domain-containing protein n=1 Tax=Streptomyces TaxID=1883 RepID=UPI003247E9A2